MKVGVKFDETLKREFFFNLKRRKRNIVSYIGCIPFLRVENELYFGIPLSVRAPSSFGE